MKEEFSLYNCLLVIGVLVLMVLAYAAGYVDCNRMWEKTEKEKVLNE